MSLNTKVVVPAPKTYRLQVRVRYSTLINRPRSTRRLFRSEIGPTDIGSRTHTRMDSTSTSKADNILQMGLTLAIRVAKGSPLLSVKMKTLRRVFDMSSSTLIAVLQAATTMTVWSTNMAVVSGGPLHLQH